MSLHLALCPRQQEKYGNTLEDSFRGEQSCVFFSHAHGKIVCDDFELRSRIGRYFHYCDRLAQDTISKMGTSDLFAYNKKNITAPSVNLRQARYTSTSTSISSTLPPYVRISS